MSSKPRADSVNSRFTRAAETAQSAVLCALLALGCGRIAGIDDYSVGEPRIENPCGALEVLRADGSCFKVGVKSCARGFDDDGGGGCRPHLPPPGACGPGEFAIPGSECHRALGPCSTGFPVNTLEGSVFVSASATGGDGTRDKPFATIGEALGKPGPLTIYVGAGTYTETLDIDRPVQINGHCFDDTTIVGSDKDKPVITLRRGADGSTVGSFEITGGKGGVLVTGAKNAVLSLWIHDVEGPGVEFGDDEQGPSSGRFYSGLIEGALGFGILVHGSEVRVGESPNFTEGVMIRGTRANEAGDFGRGISVHAAARRYAADQPLYGLTTTEFQSTLSVEDSVIEGNQDAGIFVEGSTATVHATVVRDTRPQRDGHARGIVVQRRELGPTPASLVLDESVIEGGADVGLRVDEACATVTNTTIRDIGGAEPDASDPDRSCLGNGIRVRYTRAGKAPPACASNDPPLVVEDSLVERTHEAGIFVEGAQARVERTIVRDVELEACALRFGDGIAAVGYGFAGAALDLREVRIEKVARAAVASFGADASVAESVLACGGDRLVATDGLDVAASLAVSAPSSVCGCGASWRACKRSPEQLEVALGGFGCAATDICFHSCVGDYVNEIGGGRAPISGLASWNLDRDDLATNLSDENGCTRNHGGRGARFRGAAYADGYAPGVVISVPPTADPFAQRTNMLGVSTIVFVSSLKLPGDLRDSTLVSVSVCEPPEPAPIDGSWEPCIGHGVKGARVELVSKAGEPVGQPLYVAEGGLADPSVPAVTSNSFATFWQIPSGDYTVRVLPPLEGASAIDCTSSVPFSSIGWPAERPNEFPIRVEGQGYVNGVLRAFCTLKP